MHTYTHFVCNTTILPFKHSIFSTSSIKTKCFAVSIVKNANIRPKQWHKRQCAAPNTAAVAAACQANKGKINETTGTDDISGKISTEAKRAFQFFFLSSIGMANETKSVVIKLAKRNRLCPTGPTIERHPSHVYPSHCAEYREHARDAST